MIDCHKFTFSNHYSDQRISLANSIIGEKNVKKIIALAFYFNGASRKEIAESLGIPYDSFKSFSDRIEKEGLAALFDRREKHRTLPVRAEKNVMDVPKIQAHFRDDYLDIDFEPGINIFKIPLNNSIQVKSILLSLYNNGLITQKTVSELLDYSPAHVQRLAQKLQNNDVSLFIDQRQGQKTNYKCNSQILSEIFQQFIANLTIGRSVSSQEISKDLKERCDIDIASRTIRYHLEKSGLSGIKNTLPKLLEQIKKTPEFSD